MKYNFNLEITGVGIGTGIRTFLFYIISVIIFRTL